MMNFVHVCVSSELPEPQVLDDLAAAHPTRFTVWYTLDEPPTAGADAAWAYSTGFVTAEMIGVALCRY